MVTKRDCVGVKVDWNAVEKATEIRRTYLVTDGDGNQFFKMYKPSEAKAIFNERGWTGVIASRVDKGLMFRKKPKKVSKNLDISQMIDDGHPKKSRYFSDGSGDRWR